MTPFETDYDATICEMCKCKYISHDIRQMLLLFCIIKIQFDKHLKKINWKEDSVQYILCHNNQNFIFLWWQYSTYIQGSSIFGCEK